MPVISENTLFTLKSIERGLCASTMLRRRHYDAYIATFGESGTHWFKYMLSWILSRIYDLPPPEHISSDDLIGGPRTPPKYRHIPQIVSSHSTPNNLMRSRAVMRLLHFPKYIILVRNIMDSLVSNYEKRRKSYWAQNQVNYPIDFSSYIRGDDIERFKGDVWGRVMFMNQWGTMVQRHPGKISVVKYENLRSDTIGELNKVCKFLHLENVTSEILTEVVYRASKSKMSKLPNIPGTEFIIRTDERNKLISQEDCQYIRDIIERKLEYDFGYEY